MALEIVSVKFDSGILKKMDKSIKENDFTSRTEFIRDAVRDKLAGLSREEAINEFMKLYGKAKKKVSDEELEKSGNEAIERIAKERGWKHQ
jgi:metal-responsive CopG/Arc/MetJ family transcriptional regulator